MNNSNKIILFTAFGVALLSACSNNSDLDSKKEELKKLIGQSIEIQNQIKDLKHFVDSVEGGGSGKNFTPVKVENISLVDFYHYVEVQGVVESKNEVLLNPEAPATIISIPVNEGQRIGKGEVIAVLNSDVIDKSIKELKGNFDLANTVYLKQKTLRDQNIGSEIQFLEAKNRKESLENSLATLQTQKSKYAIKSPTTGYVDQLFSKAGEMANPMMPVVRIVNADNILVKADVSESLIGKIKLGDMVTVKFPSINFTTKGKVVQSGHFIDPMNRTFKILVDLAEKNELLKPNLLSIIRITDYSKKSSIVVPSECVQEDLKGQYVYLCNSNTVDKKYVTSGKLSGNDLEILTGLKENDRVVVVGQRNVAVGEKVTVVK